jgi:hypothetical protein
MAKHNNKEAFYARLNELAQTNKPSVKESRTLGTLIGVERAADGVAYGIIKEQHQYYIKKAGLKKNPNVADFAYIGGLENITEHQYPTLASAEKNRNMMFQTINEANSLRPNPNGSKKKIMLTEDKAGEEIEMADAKVGELDAATDAAAAADAAPADGGDGMPIEPDAGGEAGTDDMLDASGAGEDLPDGGTDDLPDGDIGDVTVPDEEGMDAPVDDAGIEGIEGAEEDEGTTELQKSVSGVAKEIQDAELDKGEIKWLLDRFLSAFLPVEGEGAGVSETLTEGEEEIAVDAPIDAPVDDAPVDAPVDDVPVDDVPAEGGDDNKMAQLDIEDRQELAKKILKVVPDEEQAAVADTIPQDDGLEEDGLDINALDVAMEEGGDECAECGGFADYASSRGHDAESMMGADDEEMSNVISGYANAHADGQNDGDFKAIALFITPEILEKLKGDYGHDDFANQVEPFANEMNECGLEEKEAQINELFGGLKHLGQKAAQGIVKGAVGAGKGIAKGAVGAYQGVKQAGQEIGKAYHAGEKNAALSSLEKVATQLGQKIASVNKHAEKSGQEKINVRSILSTISNQVAGSAGTADLGKFRAAEGLAEDGSIAIEEPIDGTGIEKPVNEEGSIAIEEPIDNTGIEKPVNEEGSIAIEEPIDNTGIETLVNEIAEIAEAGIPADSVEAAPNQVEEEESAEDITNPDGDAPVEDVPEIDTEIPAEEPHVEPDGDEGPAATNIVGGFQSLGGGVVKPDGPAPVVVEIDAEANKVNVTMNEGEKKVRDYIRQQIKEQLGIEKSNLNEDQKSKKLQKVDKIIAEQLKLYESANVNESLNVPYSLKGMLSKIDPNDANKIERIFTKTFHNTLLGPEMAAISRVVQSTPIATKLEILNQYAQGGGTLGLNDQNTLILQPSAV